MNSSRIALHPHQGPSTRSDPFIRRNRSTNCDDPLPKDQTCFALNHDGSQCHAQLIQHYHKLCPRHHKDLQKSKDEYKSKELESKSIEKGEQYKENEQGIQASIIIKEEIVRLRGQVQLRFFSRAADNLGHAQRILVLQAEIRDLVAKKQSLQRNLGPGSPKVHPTQNAIDPSKDSCSSIKLAPEERNVKLVYRSLLSQQISAAELSHLGPNHPGHVIKKFMVDVANDLVNGLLKIVPALNDDLDPTVTRDDSDVANDEIPNTVVRNWFRRIVLARGQPDVLDLASRHTTIIGFLRSGVEIEELQKYTEYFENIEPDALRHLRRAISDSVSTKNRRTIRLLGGSVSAEDDLEELSTDTWDMVFCAFADAIPWYLLPCLYMSFADDLHMSKLLLLKRYGEVWLPEENSLRDTCGPIQGFVVSTQGFCDPPLPRIATEGRGVRATEFRNYVAVRMSSKDPLAEALLAELKRRTRVYLVVAWKGAGLGEPLFQSEENIFIKRTRTAKAQDDLSKAPWDVSWDVSHVISDLRWKRYIYRETHEDYLQLLLIDRVPGLPFSLMDVIANALMELSGNPSIETVVQNSLQEILPLGERKGFIEAMVAALTVDTPWPTVNFNQVSYEGNRSRCWDAAKSLPALLESHSGRKVTAENTRFISAVCKDLESKGTIRIMEEYVIPQGIACTFLGSDSKMDLYIDYRPLLATARLDAVDSQYDLPSADSLLNFATAFERRNATAIYVKGSVVTEYCAWPMDAMGPRATGLPNFTTPAGHIYQWVKAPFDYPLSAQFWQYLLSNYFNECAGFACFHLTTFVVCAVDQSDALEKIGQLYRVAQAHGLSLSIPRLSMWASDCEKIGLDKIYNGIRPAGYE